MRSKRAARRWDFIARQRAAVDTLTRPRRVDALCSAGAQNDPAWQPCCKSSIAIYSWIHRGRSRGRVSETEPSGLHIPCRASGALVRSAGIKLMLDRAARRPKPSHTARRSPAIVRVSSTGPADLKSYREKTMTTLKVLLTSSALLLSRDDIGRSAAARRTRYACRTRCACGCAGRTAGLWGADHP